MKDVKSLTQSHMPKLMAEAPGWALRGTPSGGRVCPPVFLEGEAGEPGFRLQLIVASMVLTKYLPSDHFINDYLTPVRPTFFFFNHKKLFFFSPGGGLHGILHQLGAAVVP